MFVLLVASVKQLLIIVPPNMVAVITGGDGH
jgi:hypothetical protein